MADPPSSPADSDDRAPSSVWAGLRRRWHRLRNKAVGDRLPTIDPDYVEEGARSVTEADLDTVVQRAEAIEERFRGDGPLGRLVEDGRLLLSLVRDARHGRYRAVPVWTLSATGFALLYVLNPFDLIPDALPLIGLLDDAAVISACLSLVEQDLRDYQAWRQTHHGDEQESSDDDQDLISS